MGQIELGWGLQLILWFQSWRTPLVEGVALLFHYAGSEEFMLVAVPMIYWCIDESFGRRLTLFFALNIWVNGWLKDLWHRPRPFQVSQKVHNTVPEATYGIPSGHTQHATVLWGTIALKARRYWVVAAAVIYVVLMGLARMVAGVHFPQDVIGGVVIGLILLGLYAWLEQPISTWINKLNLPMQIGVVVGMVAVMLIVHPFLIRPATVDGVDIAVSSAAALLGGGIGFALETRYLRFSADGAWWKRTVRLFLGVALLMGLRYGLKALFEGLEPVALFRLIRYSLIGFLAAFGAPWVFVKIGLAEARGH
jgi:membrane-associated phospholipid phosphatase